jgi:quercetin dioxygenase-like cupin family protein
VSDRTTKPQAAFEVDAEPTDGYHALRCHAIGSASSILFHPDGFSLWRLNAELDAGTRLEWATAHGDEALFVVAGELDVDGRRCAEEGVVIVEADAQPNVRAVIATQLLHFGPTDTEVPRNGLFGPPGEPGRGVHLFSAADGEALRTMATTFFSDGACPTCRIAFFTVDLMTVTEPKTYASHLHSEDELIHVLDGTMKVGPNSVRAGRAAAIPRDLRYRFGSDGPLRFLNYRRAASTMLETPGSQLEWETRARMLERMASGEFNSR